MEKLKEICLDIFDEYKILSRLSFDVMGYEYLIIGYIGGKEIVHTIYEDQLSDINYDFNLIVEQLQEKIWALKTGKIRDATNRPNVVIVDDMDTNDDDSDKLEAFIKYYFPNLSKEEFKHWGRL